MFGAATHTMHTPWNLGQLQTQVGVFVWNLGVYSSYFSFHKKKRSLSLPKRHQQPYAGNDAKENTTDIKVTA